MKLSEYMRLGAMQGKQLFGKLINGTGDSCAIGSVMIAAGVVGPTQPYPELLAGYKLFAMFPVLDNTVPGLLGDEILARLSTGDVRPRSASVWNLIVWLNNIKKLTREQIADYLVEHDLDCEAVLPEAKEVEEQEAVSV